MATILAHVAAASYWEDGKCNQKLLVEGQDAHSRCLCLTITPQVWSEGGYTERADLSGSALLSMNFRSRDVLNNLRQGADDHGTRFIIALAAPPRPQDRCEVAQALCALPDPTPRD